MQIPKIYGDILAHSTHLLIAGTTGSGKSVTLHGLITDLLLSENPPFFAFIDLKRVEMIEYKRMRNTIAYADTTAAAMKLLEYIIQIMNKRYKRMMKRREKKSTETPIYLIIDEYAELFLNSKKQCVPLIMSILQLGRACNIRAIIATQSPKADILNTNIKANISSTLALRTRSAQDSRNIIGFSGAEKLPLNKFGIFLCPSLLQPLTVKLPMIDETERLKLIKQYY